jgi:hypothetical protein
VAFPEVRDFPKSHPGPYERGMGRTIAALLRLFRDRVPDSESAARVAELANTPDRWSAAHAVFDEIRGRLLDARGDTPRARQYAFEEACCQSLYNATAADDPFDASAPFFVAPAAFSLAEALGCPTESVVEALKPRWEDSRAADG